MKLLLAFLLYTGFIYSQKINGNSFESNFSAWTNCFPGNFIFHINHADTAIPMNQVTIDDSAILISDKFSFTEGPAADSNGNIFFTDQPKNQIWKYNVEGKLTLFMDQTGRSNGMHFDKKGNIISCADEHNQLWSISPKKKVTVLVNNYEGQTFNGPNDVWVNPVSGDIYFTDPYYKRDYWKKDHVHMKEERLYFLAKNTKGAIIADGELTKPNGIVGTPDGKFLYVADIGANKTFIYKINKDGTLSDKKLFVEQGSDGMTIDNAGNVYLTGKGVTIYNHEGKMIQKIPINEDWTGNICFGGSDKNILFITASKSIYIMHMKVKGTY
ncbi:MAG: SMP-30/gluconolactonase/LRE family protein [Bacteroidota bacterium]|nr:SMP-30/gluconolactonase/LRE family protein [Bacteroidota bacterium]